MTDRLASIERLRRLADRLATGGPDEQWLAEALARYLRRAQSGLSLDAALGVATPQGARRWTTIETQSTKAAIARELAARYPGGPTAKARAVAGAVRAYESQCWTRDRRAQAMPSHYAGTARELLWRAFRQHGGLPSSARQIMRLLEGGDCDMSSSISCHAASPMVTDQEDSHA